MALSKNSQAFRINYEMMTTAGIWPINSPNLIYKLRSAISWFLSLGLCITMWMETINDIKDLTKLSEILYIMVTITAYIIKLLSFTYHKKTFVKLTEFLNDSIFVSYPEDLDHYMKKSIKLSTLIANVYRYLVLCCVLLYLVYPILDKTPLPFPFPYDMGRYNYYMYAFQLAGESVCAWNNSSLDTLCTSLMGIGVAQLNILSDKITLLKNENIAAGNHKASDATDNSISKKLEQCVQHHLAIIKYIETVEHIFTLGLLAQLVTSVIVICNTLFHFILISLSLQFFMLANYFVIIMVQLFMYCWYGNEIMLKSVKIGEACYMFNWETSGNNVRKCLFIMMERSKRPLKITTMKLSTLCLTAFASLLQWSYSCLALLLKMYYKAYEN